jgi:FkbM family methyltransferase
VIVVDLGCADRGEWFSLEALVNEYHPELIYGFDPSPLLNTRRRKVNGVPVKLERKAAWLFDGTVEFNDDYMHGGPEAIGHGTCAVGAGSLGRIGTIIEHGGLTVECFDFSVWLAEHGPCVVKMDLEGAEYPLLEHLIAQGTNRLVSELVIEWHEQPADHLTEHFVSVRDWWM